MHLFLVTCIALFCCSQIGLSNDNTSDAKHIALTIRKIEKGYFIVPFPIYTNNGLPRLIYKNAFCGIQIEEIEADGKPVKGEDVFLADLNVNPIESIGNVYCYFMTSTQVISAIGNPRSKDYKLLDFNISSACKQLKIKYRFRSYDGKLSEMYYLVLNVE